MKTYAEAKQWAPPSRNGNVSVLLTIPAYNEQGCIREVVNGARRALPVADVLVIDDGSTDDTASEADAAGAFVVRHPFNLGIGASVQTGLKFARQMAYDIVLRLDGDGQHDPRSLSVVLAPVQQNQADVTVGSRFLDGKPEMKIPLVRQLGISLFARQVSWLTGTRATDTTSGLSAMNRRAVHLLAAYMPQDYPEVQCRIILHYAGLTTQEVPVRMRERTSGVTSINHWRSIYYAVKVSIAVLLAALKQTPEVTKEIPDAQRAMAHSSRS